MQVANRLPRGIARLFQPAPSSPRDSADQAQLLSALLLCLVVLAMIAAGVQRTPAARLELAAWSGVYALLYGLSRTRFRISAAVFTIGCLLAMPIVGASIRPFTSTSELSRTLLWGVPGLILGGILLRTRTLALLIVANQVALALLPWWSPHASRQGTYFVQSFDLSIGLLMLIVTAMRDRNLSRRREVEQAYQQSERRFQALFERAPIPMTLADLQGRILEANPAFQALLGYGETEIKGMSASAFTRSFDLSELAGSFLPLSRGERQTMRAETAAIRKDGTEIWLRIQAAPLMDEHDAITGIVTMAENVTDLKLAEEALHQEKERWQLALQGSNDGLWDVDLRSGLFYFSERLLDMLGYERSELPASPRDFVPFFAEEDQAPVIAAVRAHLARRVPFFSIEVRIRCRTGSYKWVLLRGQALWDEAGTPVRFVGSATDHSHRKQAEHDLIAAREAALRASNAKSAFVATISHEMRTPLNALIGLADVLWDTPLSEEQQEYVKVFRRVGADLHSLINDILDMSRVESGRLELEARDFDLFELVAEVMEVLARPSAEKGLQLTSHIAPEIPRQLHGDAQRVRQILVNLLGNAVKFTLRGSVELRIGAGPEPGHLHVSVVDTGIGISQDKLETIFQSFTQADSSTTREFGGSGLGLTITRQLVELMGGRIDVESTLDVGSTFRLVLPLRPAQHPPAALPKSGQPVPVSSAGLHLLLAEDNLDNTRVLEAFLKGYPYEVTIARNGIEALECFQAGSYDLVLMDIHMPVMDGFEATRRIREWEAQRGLRPTPIIALTASTLKGEVSDCLEAGCTSHLAKPLHKADILELLARYQRILRLPAAEGSTRVSIQQDLAGLIPGYLAGRRMDVLRIREALQSDDLVTVAKIAHDLKGSGASYGFPDITDIGRGLERAAKSGDHSGLVEGLTDFERYLALVQVQYV